MSHRKVQEHPWTCTLPFLRRKIVIPNRIIDAVIGVLLHVIAIVGFNNVIVHMVIGFDWNQQQIVAHFW